MLKTKLLSVLLVGISLAVGLAAAPAAGQLARDTAVIERIDPVGVAYDAEARTVTATGGTVEGTMAGLRFSTEITGLTIRHLPDVVAGEPCAVLDLHLAPVDRDRQGLHVDISAICLSISGTEGEGILGDLVCGAAGGELELLDELFGSLADLVTELLQSAPPSAGGPHDICDGECEIRYAAVGPIDLNLLGLNIYLDDCDGGPIQVCLSASEGEGVLGDLLCDLAGDDNLPDLVDLEAVINAIDDLLGLDLPPGQLQKLEVVLRKLLADGVLSESDLAELAELVKKIEGNR